MVATFGFMKSSNQASGLFGELATTGTALYKWLAPRAIGRVYGIPGGLVAHFHGLGSLGDGAGFGNTLQKLDASPAQEVDASQRKPQTPMGFE